MWIPRPVRKVKKDSQEISGGTLIETMISVAIFAVLVLSVFAVFQIGNENWSLMVVDHSLQNDGREAVAFLQKDLESTALNSVDVDSETTNTTANIPVIGGASGATYPVPRDAVAMVGLDNWSDPDNFDSTLGLPIWDEYIIYLATTQINVGQGSDVGDGLFLKIVIRFKRDSAKANCPNGPGQNNCLDHYITNKTSGAEITPLPLYFSSYYTSGLDTLVSDVNTNISSLFGANAGTIESDLGLPKSPPIKDIVIDNLSPVYAFEAYQCDGAPLSGCNVPSIGISYKVRKRALQQQGAGLVKTQGGNSTENGMQSFQINLVVSPQANQNF